MIRYLVELVESRRRVRQLKRSIAILNRELDEALARARRRR